MTEAEKIKLAAALRVLVGRYYVYDINSLARILGSPEMPEDDKHVGFYEEELSKAAENTVAELITRALEK